MISYYINSEWQALKTLAQPLAERLQDESASGWTLIHGDFKSANLMFSRPPPDEDEDPFFQVRSSCRVEKLVFMTLLFLSFLLSSLLK